MPKANQAVAGEVRGCTHHCRQVARSPRRALAQGLARPALQRRPALRTPSPTSGPPTSRFAPWEPCRPRSHAPEHAGACLGRKAALGRDVQALVRSHVHGEGLRRHRAVLRLTGPGLDAGIMAASSSSGMPRPGQRTCSSGWSQAGKASELEQLLTCT
jgi:hypothetical protein